MPTSDIPAVTHVDYSARIQTVDRESNPRYYRSFEAFEAQTGCGVLVNTSFNVRGEPIVCTPEDAYRCFMRTEMDLLVLENCVLEKAAQPPLVGRHRLEERVRARLRCEVGLTPPRADVRGLRSFGLTVGGIFAAIGLWPPVVRAASPRWWALASVCPARVGPDRRRGLWARPTAVDGARPRFSAGSTRGSCFPLCSSAWSPRWAWSCGS